LRGTWLEVDLDAIRGNCRWLARRAGKELMAVVKANGYGHGALPVAEAALAAGATWLGVATVAEGLALRHGNIQAPILVLGPTEPEAAVPARASALRLTVADPALASAFGRAAPGLTVHLKVDTGMGRFGARPEEALWLYDACRAAGLSVEGVFTHFADADADEGFTQVQASALASLVARLRSTGREVAVVHAENSAGLMIGAAPFATLARSGIALYGLAPRGTGALPRGLKPALTWRARVAHLKVLRPGESVGYGRTYRAERPTVIVTLPFGYADGYPRALGQRADVLLAGVRCRVVGRVSMDQVTVAVPDGVPVHLGDEAVVVGEQGQEALRLEELAELSGTINYELAAGLSARLERRYRGAGGGGGHA
jgi:alanine racemase